MQSTVSKREVDQDEFQEILEEQGQLKRKNRHWPSCARQTEGLADFQEEEEEPGKPKLVERTDTWGQHVRSFLMWSPQGSARFSWLPLPESTKEFESTVGVLIAINSIVMGFEADAIEKRAVGWVIVENFFCLLWISEMLLKLWAYHLAYFRSGWNVPRAAIVPAVFFKSAHALGKCQVFDFCLVLLNIFETWIIPSFAIGDLDAIGVLRIAPAQQ